MAKFKESFIQNFASFVYEDICREKMWKMLHTLQEKMPASVSLTGAKNIQYIISAR